MFNAGARWQEGFADSPDGGLDWTPYARVDTEEMDSESLSEDMNIPVEWYHKFAELIITECIGLANNEYKRNWALNGTEFLEHFGVKK